jgi:hypothetical protein
MLHPDSSKMVTPATKQASGIAVDNATLRVYNGNCKEGLRGTHQILHIKAKSLIRVQELRAGQELSTDVDPPAGVPGFRDPQLMFADVAAVQRRGRIIALK